MSFRAQRSGAEESRCRAPPFLPLLVGATLVVARLPLRPFSPSFILNLSPPFFPRRACPREDTPTRCPRVEILPPEDGGRGPIPFPHTSFQPALPTCHSERSAAKSRNLVVFAPSPSPRRGDPSGRPSLFGHSLLPSPSSSPLHSSREEPALVKTPLPLSSRRDPAPVKTGDGDPSPSPTCHSERSRGILSPSRPVCPP